MRVGKVDLPDAVNTIKWKKIGGNQTIESDEKYKIKEVIRYTYTALLINYKYKQRTKPFAGITIVLMFLYRFFPTQRKRPSIGSILVHKQNSRD